MVSIEIHGQLFQAHASAHQEIALHFTADGRLKLSTSDVSLDVDISDVTISSKLGSTPRQITFSEGHLFVFNGNAEIDHWLDKHGHKSVISRFESSWRFVALAFVLTPLMLIAIYRFAIPAVAIHFSGLVPDAAISTSSQHTLKTLDKFMLEPSKFEQEKQHAFITKWETNIAKLLGSEHQYHFHFRASEKMGANAFALPDGTIVVTDELVTLMEAHPDALFSIILHEIGHVELKHSMRYIAETLATSVLVNYMFGDISGVIDLFVGMSATMVSNQFSQELEWQADNFALAVLKDNDMSTESFAQAMELFLSEVEESSIEHLLSTHPMLKERIENARSKN